MKSHKKFLTEKSHIPLRSRRVFKSKMSASARVTSTLSCNVLLTTGMSKQKVTNNRMRAPSLMCGLNYSSKSQTPKMKFMKKKRPVTEASRSFAFDRFKFISHNTALQVPFSLCLFFFFSVFSHCASSGR